MKIRSVEELGEFLDRELAWRKKELSVVKLSLDRAGTTDSAYFCRVAICMLYAHWEGFIKAAATGYVCYVTTRRLRYRELSDGFVALGLRSTISRAGQSKRTTDYIDLISVVRSDLSDRLDIDCTKAIDVQSNLDSKVLLDILYTFALNRVPYLTKAALIDNKLLNRRNNIAHGRSLEVEKQEYQTVHAQIVGLIDKFKDDVEDAAHRKLYRR